jgi:hypothetical protein
MATQWKIVGSRMSRGWPTSLFPQLPFGNLVIVGLERLVDLLSVHLVDGVVAPAWLTFPKSLGYVSGRLLGLSTTFVQR